MMTRETDIYLLVTMCTSLCYVLYVHIYLILAVIMGGYLLFTDDKIQV